MLSIEGFFAAPRASSAAAALGEQRLCRLKCGTAFLLTMREVCCSSGLNLLNLLMKRASVSSDAETPAREHEIHDPGNELAAASEMHATWRADPYETDVFQEISMADAAANFLAARNKTLAGSVFSCRESCVQSLEFRAAPS